MTAASPSRIKTMDEILVHAPASLGSCEQVHWVGNNPKWFEVMRQLTDLLARLPTRVVLPRPQVQPRAHLAAFPAPPTASRGVFSGLRALQARPAPA
jgi:hypothetical protein